MISKGTLKARGVEAALGFANTGTEQVAVLLDVTDRDGEVHQLTWYGFFTEKTTERTFESLRALGWNGEDLFDLSGITANEVSVVVEHEEDDRGKVHAKVRWINGGGGLAMKARMDAGQAKAFAARMRGQALASKQKAAGSQSQASKPRASNGPQGPNREEPPIDAYDDEIAF